MIDIFDYENKNVIVECKNGKIYKGKVNWCAYAEEVDEESNLISIDHIGILESDIKSIKEIA